MKRIGVVFFLMLGMYAVQAQTWSLEQCIQFAHEHNITIQQSELNQRLADLQLKQIQNSRYPNLNLSFSNGLSNGRSVDPTTNQFINNTYYFNGLNANAGVLLFGAFQRKYQEEQAHYDVMASSIQYKQLQNDIALNIASAYLRALLAKEQTSNIVTQMTTDVEQAENTKKRVEAGSLPQLNLLQVKALVANDSASYISALANEQQSLLELRALLNFDFLTPFQIISPTISNVSFEQILNLPQPEDIYATALKNQPSILYQDMKLKSVEKNIAIAQSGFYPQLSLGYSAGTNFANTVKEITGATYIGEEEIASLKFGDTSLPITRPSYNYTTQTVPLFNQYGNNFRQTLSMNLNIPIFNNFNNRTNLSRAKIGYQNQILQRDAELLKLKQNIYLAYNDVKNATQKYKASKQATEVEQQAFDYATQRYEIGLLNTLEYITQQNNLIKSKNNELITKYDLIFKSKILAFYMGEKLKL